MYVCMPMCMCVSAMCIRRAVRESMCVNTFECDAHMQDCVCVCVSERECVCACVCVCVFVNVMWMCRAVRGSVCVHVGVCACVCILSYNTHTHLSPQLPQVLHTAGCYKPTQLHSNIRWQHTDCYQLCVAL